MTNKNPKRNVPGWRKFLYYLGNIIIVIGFIMFFSVFFSFFSIFKNSDDLGFGFFSSFQYSFIGFLLIFIGTILKNIGIRGLAGSGVILDPEKEREDLEPFSRSKGGMFADSYNEFKEQSNFDEDIDKIKDKDQVKIMVRCPNCKSLNDENAKFCSNCGKPLM